MQQGIKKVSKKGRVYYDNGDHIYFPDTNEKRMKTNNNYRPYNGNIPTYGSQGFGANQNSWDGFKRSGFVVTQGKELGKMHAHGWKAQKGGNLKVNWNEATTWGGKERESRGEQKTGKNKGEMFYFGVLTITNTKTMAEIVENACLFTRKDGEMYLTSEKLGLIMTTRGSGKTRSGKISKGAIIKMKK